MWQYLKSDLSLWITYRNQDNKEKASHTQSNLHSSRFQLPTFPPSSSNFIYMAVAAHHSFTNHSKEPPATDQQPKLLKHKTSNLRAKQSYKLQRLSLSHSLCRHADAGRMDEALQLFDSATNPDTFLFNVMIRGYTNISFFDEAIDFYYRMQAAGRMANNFTYPFVIKSCAALSLCDEGLRAHGRLLKAGLDSDLFICNSLITFYSRVGLVESSERVFDEMPMRDNVSWNSMIDGLVTKGEGSRALMFFREMQVSGLKPDQVGIMSAAMACSSEMCWKQGKEIHCHAIRHGLDQDIRVQSSLLDMYCKCRDMVSADRSFNRIHQKNVVVWNILIGGYTLNSRPQDAFVCTTQMQNHSVDPDAVTMVNLIPACEQINSVSHGKAIHGLAVRKGFVPHLVLETALVDMYGKCTELKSAELLFEQMAERSIVSWNAMISAYVQNQQSVEALKLFLNLQEEVLQPDAFTISSIIPAYADIASLRHGKQIHGYAIKSGCENNSCIINSIIYMYGRCGDLQSSREVFDRMLCKDIISWNAVIMGYGAHGLGRTALELFSDMKEIGLKPNEATFVSVLSACSLSGLVEEGWMHFSSMQEEYCFVPQIEHYGYMVDLLGRSGDLEIALDFIEKMPLTPTARIWGSFLTACRNNNSIELAELAADRIFAIEHDNTGCYVLLSSMYADAGRWEDAERVRYLMKEKGLNKTNARSLVELNSKTWNFVNGDRSHVESCTITEVSYILSRKIEDALSDPITTCTPLEVVARKRNSPYEHSVRLAVSFGLISSTVGTPILIKKNTRICNSCHNAIKLISEYSKREIIVGDTRIYHHFNNGLCSCGDYW